MNEKIWISFWVGVFLCISGLFATGCGTFAPFHSLQKPPTAETISNAGKIPADEKVTITNVSPVQKVVNYETDLMIWAGAICLIAAGALAYFQMYFMAIKVGLAGLVLPIFAVWFSHYWGWLIAAALIGVAVIAYMHWKVVLQPIVKAAASDIQMLATKVSIEAKSAPGYVTTTIQKKI